ncbi:MAG: methylmalonyl-CoA carboxyltransferase [Desulfotomaculum sp. BICA1-6]|nr:MAG: methylmalonyl-CoA carboxyltransferase [Peptococcaceae bacterium BRH_c8a]KJS78137.1 MAG: methylmalonyl-CoA carboxyltransferase [Desulfotomaculum sp. BICA1-6]
MSMQEKLDQLKELRAKVQAGGGEKKIAKQHAAGKMTARERIDYFFDQDTFREIDVFAGEPDKNPSEGVVTGFGLVNGRKVFVYAQDFTVTGGSLGMVHAQKICKVLDLAMRNGAPVVGLNDSGGARIQEGVDALNGFGEIFFRNTIASGVIPQLSVIMGPCAGGAVYSPALMDFIFMVNGTSQMFITGPQVIRAVTGEEVSMEQLGGALTHNQTSGVAHFMGENEEHCLDTVKNLLGYLPASNTEKPPLSESVEPAVDREALLDIVPAQPMFSYDVKKVIQAVVDGSEFLEVLPLYAKNAVVGFARFAGQPVGIVANQPDFMAGCLDINASDKISRFVRFCDAFNIPLVTFMDVPGFLPGTGQEFGGIIRHGAKMLYAYSEATVPKVTIILRKAYGGAYLAMCSSSLRADMVYAWPTAEIAVMGPEGAVNIIKRKEIENAANPAEERSRLVQEYRDKFANPYVASSRGFVDDVIDPRETRAKIIDAIESLASKRESRPSKKHGNLPV